VAVDGEDIFFQRHRNRAIKVRRVNAEEGSSGLHVQGLLGLFHCPLHDSYQPFEVSLRPAE